MPFKVLRLTALATVLGLAACAGHPTLQEATPDIVRQGTEVSRTQVGEAATVVCPANTRRREWVEYETRVQSGRGGSPSAIVRVQCIPNDMRPEEIPPLTRSASPPSSPPVVAPAQSGHRIPYLGYDTGHRPPGWYWRGGGSQPSYYPPPGYAPNGYAPVWDGSTRTWWCRNWYGTRYQCIFQ